MRRRELLLRSALLPVVAVLGHAGPAHADDAPPPDKPFDGATVRNLARDLAQQAYKAPDASLPDTLNNLDYQAYRSIRFDPGHALWRGQGLKFTEEFFHRGFLYKQRVDIFEVANGHAVQIRYSPDLFTFDKVKPPNDDIGFAGFRLHYPLNRPDYFDEICAFLGASYFRAVAKDQGYGLSARGLAIKTADSAGEEFPAVPHVLAGTAGEGQRRDRRARAARQPERRGGVPLHHPPGGADGVRHRDGAVSAHRSRHRRHRAADLDVPVRRQRPHARR